MTASVIPGNVKLLCNESSLKATGGRLHICPILLFIDSVTEHALGLHQNNDTELVNDGKLC